MSSTTTRRPFGRRNLITTLLAGVALGWLVAAGCSSTRQELDIPLMRQAWEFIQQKYVDQAAVKPRLATYEAIAGMVDSLGDTGHSTFLTPALVHHLQAVERGELKGIGVEIQMKKGRAVIVAPLDDSPARRAGLRSGDIILKVNGHDLNEGSLSEVAERIAGPAGTWVHLTILTPRGGHTREVAVMRETIKLREVTWQRLPGIGMVYLRIANFDSGATRDLKAALSTIMHDRPQGMVLDLRDNPGGLLDEAVGVASQFLSDGNVVLVRNAKGRILPVPAQKGGLAPAIPLAVLINNGTASAAEIVAGALRDGHRAVLVGEPTFGTGTVLEKFDLADGSALLLAVDEWLTPDGHSFWHKGIAPRDEVALPEDATPLFLESEEGLKERNLTSSHDTQLLRAIEAAREEAARTARR